MQTSSDILQHYDAAKPPRGMLSYATGLWDYPRQIAASRTLVWNFFRRLLLGRFRGSFGGVFWVLVQPIFQFLIYYMVFGFLFSRGGMGDGPSESFAFYLFAGVVMFGAIQECGAQGMSCVTGNSNLVKKVAFPCQLLPLAPALTAMIVYVVGCALLMILGLSLGETSVGPALLLWPVVLLCLLLFGTGLGLLLGAANVFVRDIGQLWPLLSMAWFFGTPVFWNIALLRDKLVDADALWALDLLLINPAYGLLMAQREVFGLGHALTEATRPDWFYHDLSVTLGVAVAWSVAMFLLGYGFFMSRKHKFADLV